MRRDLAVGLSLANLCFIGIWADLLPFLYLSEGYPIGAFPCPRDFGAAVLNVAWLGAVFGLAIWLAGKLSGRAAFLSRLAFLAVLVIPLNAIRMHFNTWPERWWNGAPPEWAGWIGVLGVSVALMAVWKWNVQVVKLARAALLIMLPLAPVMLFQAFWAMAAVPCGEEAQLARELPASGSSPRVVWVVFDELEQRALFEKRPKGVNLPAFDRLRREAVTASQAQAPGHETERSIPSYLTGRIVTRALVTGPNRLLIQIEGASSMEPLGSQPHVFSKARAMGLNTALAGWFMPYCAFLSADLNACSWEPCVTCGRRVGSYGSSVGESLVNQLSELGPRHGPRQHIASYRRIAAASRVLAADARYGFVFLHFPVPHDPWIFDAKTHQLQWLRRSGRGYFDNLTLADETLADLRRVMEETGQWHRSTVLVVGDHGWRKPEGFDGGTIDHRVPFMVKLAGADAAASFDAPLGAVAAHDLTMALLAGEVRTADETVAWLERWSASGAETLSGSRDDSAIR